MVVEDPEPLVYTRVELVEAVETACRLVTSVTTAELEVVVGETFEVGVEEV